MSELFADYGTMKLINNNPFSSEILKKIAS